VALATLLVLLLPDRYSEERLIVGESGIGLVRRMGEPLPAGNRRVDRLIWHFSEMIVPQRAFIFRGRRWRWMGIMHVRMRCCHLEHKGEVWKLALEDNHAEIRDADGTVRAEYTRQQAVQQFLLPSFSESIKQFRAPLEGELWYFDVARNGLKQIKAYLDKAVVAAGPKAVRAVRNRALRDTLIGVGGVVLGTALSIGSYLHAAQTEGNGEYFVTYGVILFGLIMIGKGINSFLCYGKLQKLSQKERRNRMDAEKSDETDRPRQ
jgi:hypothetical protein